MRWPRIASLLALFVILSAATYGTAGANALGAANGGIMTAAKETQSFAHAYWFTLQNVTFDGAWHIGDTTHVFAATTPVLILGTQDGATGDVQQFDLTGVGSDGTMEAACAMGSASFISYSGSTYSASFTTTCQATINGGSTQPLVLSATVSLAPDAVVTSTYEQVASAVSPPTVGTFST